MTTKSYIYFQVIVAQIILNFAALSSLISFIKHPNSVHVVFWTSFWKFCKNIMCSIIGTQGT